MRGVGRPFQEVEPFEGSYSVTIENIPSSVVAPLLHEIGKLGLTDVESSITVAAPAELQVLSEQDFTERADGTLLDGRIWGTLERLVDRYPQFPLRRAIARDGAINLVGDMGYAYSWIKQNHGHITALGPMVRALRTRAAHLKDSAIVAADDTIE